MTDLKEFQQFSALPKELWVLIWQKSLEELSDRRKTLKILLFGESEPPNARDPHLHIHWRKSYTREGELIPAEPPWKFWEDERDELNKEREERGWGPAFAKRLSYLLAMRQDTKLKRSTIRSDLLTSSAVLIGKRNAMTLLITAQPTSLTSTRL